jgi:hypothetical protein
MMSSYISHSRDAVIFFIAGIIFCAVVGCGRDVGPQRGTVAGVITIDGEAVDEGSISFIPTGGTVGPITGGVINQGAYKLPRGAIVGTHRVEIHAQRKTGRLVPALPPASPDTMVDEMVSITPPKFNSESTLTATVAPGENNIDFHLKTDQ